MLRCSAPLLFLASAVLLAGCGTLRKKSVAPSPSELTAPLHLELGRIIALQPEAGTALVEFTPHARVPAPLAGRSLLARKLDTLEVTAQLVASPQQRGRILGVYIITGTPGLDDEVVLVPPPPIEPPPPPPPPPAR